MTRELLAGVARTDITPPIGIAHANWGAQTHQRAVGVDLPLWATALALSDGDQTVVMVDIDLGGGRNVAEIREAISELTGLPPSHIRLSYIHTHSGPSSNPWIAEGAEMFGPYTDSLVHKIAGAAWAAIRDLRPARIAAGGGSCRIAVNRRFHRPEDGVVVVGRNWEGLVDHEVKLLRIDDKGGQPLAAVVNYACHPITVGPDNDLITPDYPGAMKRVVESATGATCLFFQGAAGNVGPIRGVARGGITEYKRLGAMLGHEASRIWWEMELPPRTERYVETLESGAPLAVYAEEPVEDPDATLRVGTRPMHLPLKQLPEPELVEAELKEHLARLNELRATDASAGEIRWQTMLSKRAAMRARTARDLHGQTHQTFELQAFTIGDEIALVCTPGEPFAEIGLKVKQDSPFKHTLFSGYSNVGWLYIPMPDAYPQGGYEVEWATPFGPGAAEVVVEEGLALLNELAN